MEQGAGREIVVLGNHDTGGAGAARIEPDRTVVTLIAPGRPPLVMTHAPLIDVPAGCVSVHGHMREAP